MMLKNKNKYLVEFEEVCALSLTNGNERVILVLFDCPCCGSKRVATNIVNESLNHRFNNGNIVFKCVVCDAQYKLDHIGDEYLLWSIERWDK